jgi:signal transduction histidine kinase
MCIKPHRILLIEPDSTRGELIRAALAESPPALEFQVVSSLAEAQSQLDSSPPGMVFLSLSLQKLGSEAGGDAGAERKNFDNLPDRQPETAGFAAQIANLSHALRGSLGVILNATFLLKRKGAEDQVLLEKYLDVIEQEAMAAGQILSDHAHSVQ